MGVGFVFYSGASRIDGKPIVGILTSGTANQKTGPMLQTWILPDTGKTIGQIISDKEDASVCGDCVLRHNLGGGCYVLPYQAPGQILRKYRADGYKTLTSEFHALYVLGWGVRCGSYGDPTAIPLDTWKGLLKGTSFHTGYTQRWRDPDNASYASLLMASVRSTEDAEEARRLGWRYYRMRRPGDPVTAGEVQCPAAKEVVNKSSCAACKLCDGTGKRRKASVSIEIHGHIAVWTRAMRSMPTPVGTISAETEQL